MRMANLQVERTVWEFVRGCQCWDKVNLCVLGIPQFRTQNLMGKPAHSVDEAALALVTDSEDVDAILCR